MERESWRGNFNRDINKKAFYENQKLTAPLIEMSNEEYLCFIQVKWFNDDIYNYIKKHKYCIVIKNAQTGEKTAIRTFGARFPMVTTKIA
ncbi:hypothetical protein P4679_23730 [Priestia megaterium]|uniref:hypothetical protein n=1 Tax=Priestia megaterium TaxID=1404 RepID=UPI002E1C1DF6|nr:hypothetical protein [Priestia megaterium]